MKQFHGEESNYFVLKEVVDALEKGESSEDILPSLKEFLLSKEVIRTELEELTIKARHGDDQAAKDLISKLAEMNDGQ